MTSASDDYRRRWLERAQRAERPMTTARSAAGGSGSVRALYEHYPYPSREQSAPIRDLSNAIELLLGDGDMSGWRVLDAGCGTGQRLVGMARRFPHARFTGLDMSTASLKVASALIERHGLTNVTLIECDMSSGSVPGTYELIVSTGVVHHLPSPRAGLAALAGALSDDGLLYVWLYHAYGEFERMLQRALVSVFRRDAGDLEDGLAIVDALGCVLLDEQYGATGATAEDVDEWRRSKLADAYLHPIIHTLRFDEAVDLLNDTGVEWAGINGCNCVSRSHLFDLERLAQGLERELSIYPEVAFDHPDIRQRALGLDALQQLTALELALKPTGFSVVAGRNSALRHCTPRVAGNVTRRWGS